jgi:hypothetical protein
VPLDVGVCPRPVAVLRGTADESHGERPRPVQRLNELAPGHFGAFELLGKSLLSVILPRTQSSAYGSLMSESSVKTPSGRCQRTRNQRAR